MSTGLQQHDRQPTNGCLHFSCSAWAVIVDGKLHSARATEHEARIVGFNFSDKKTVEIIPCTLTQNTEVRHPETKPTTK